MEKMGSSDDMMKFQPVFISIITPAYNAGRFIGETIESVQAQTYPHWEMLIVDDGSTDDTRMIAAAYAGSDKRIVMLSAGQNSGPATARNIGLQQARGRYIVFLDSDDLLLPDKLALQLQFMRSNHAAFSFTAYRQMSEDGLQLGALIEAVATVSYWDELHTTLIGGGTVMLDRQMTGEFAFESVRNEDYLLWLTLLKRGHMAYGLSIDLARYRQPERSRSSNKLTSARGVWKVLRQHEQLHFCKALACFASYAVRSSWRNYRAKPARGSGKAGGIRL